MGGPDMARSVTWGPRHGPPNPPTLGVPRQSRGAPRSPAVCSRPDMPLNPNARLDHAMLTLHPSARRAFEAATAPPGRGTRGGFGGPLGAPSTQGVIEERPGSGGARRTTGGWGPSRGPQHTGRDRGATRLRRGATNDGGLGALSGAPMLIKSRR